MKRFGTLAACLLCTLSLTGCYTRGGWYFDPFMSIGIGDCGIGDDCDECGGYGNECCDTCGTEYGGMQHYGGPVEYGYQAPGAPMYNATPTPVPAPAADVPAAPGPQTNLRQAPPAYAASPRHAVPPAAYEGPVPGMQARDIPVDAPSRL